MSEWRRAGVLAAAVFVAAGQQRLMAQDSSAAPSDVLAKPKRDSIAIGVGVERFGVVFERLGAIHEGLLTDPGQMLTTAMLVVPISPRFAIQATAAGHRTRNLTGEHTEVLYGFMVNQRIGRLGRRVLQPYVTYGLLGLVSNTAVPPSTEWVYNGTAWEERPVAAYTRRSHRWPTVPIGGAGLQFHVWRGLAVRAEAELLGPSAGRVRASVMVPIGVRLGRG